MATMKKSVTSKETVANTKTATTPKDSINLKKAAIKPKKVTTIRSKKVDVQPEVKKVLDTKNLKDTVKTAVTSMRQVKWKYPSDINDPLERKAWRGTQRTKMTKLEAAITTAESEKSKKANEKALAEYRKEVLLVP